MTRLPSLGLTLLTGAVAGCGRAAAPPVAPHPLEPLFNTNTVCYRSLTFDQQGFGDPTRPAQADTSYLVIHGLTDTLVGTTNGPAWVALAANGWAMQQDRWRRTSADSIEVAFIYRTSRHEYQLALFEEAAWGIGQEYEKTVDSTRAPAVYKWDMVLSRIHCSGLREPTAPPARRSNKPM